MPLAYHINNIPEVTGGAVTRTAAYQAIREGKLLAHKSGRRTFVTDPNLRAYLETCPAVQVCGKVGA